MMVALIVALLLQFMAEMNGLKYEEKMRKWLPRILGIGLGELSLCGIYYTAKVNGTSLLDIGTIWGEHSLVLQDLFPFNWYFSMAFGVITYWNVYRIFCLFVNQKEAENGLCLSLALPGNYLLFLPFRCSVIWLILSILLRVLFTLWIGRDRCWNVGKWFESIWNRIGDVGYFSILTILVMLNGASVILLLGVS